MIIVEDQWTAILANFVRKKVMFSNLIKEMYYLCNERQRQEKLASLIFYTKHMLKSTYKITLFFTSNRIATHFFQVYTITLKAVLEIVAIYLSLETRLCDVFVFHKQYIKRCIINATKEKIYQFILKSYIRTLRVNKYM